VLNFCRLYTDQDVVLSSTTRLEGTYGFLIYPLHDDCSSYLQSGCWAPFLWIQDALLCRCCMVASGCLMYVLISSVSNKTQIKVVCISSKGSGRNLLWKKIYNGFICRETVSSLSCPCRTPKPKITTLYYRTTLYKIYHIYKIGIYADKKVGI
jgi:hypothetical protein